MKHGENPEPPPPVAGIDIVGLVYLIGELVSPTDPVDRRRRTLLDGLGEWIGADAWYWLRRSDPSASWQSGLDPGTWDLIRHPPASNPPPDLPGIGHTLSRSSGIQPFTSVALCRHPDHHAFSARETRLAAIILEETPWLYLDHPGSPGSSLLLSPRQALIADLLNQGMSRKEIVRHLGITSNTLASHIKKIYLRLGIHSQSSLIHTHNQTPAEETDPSPP